MMAEESRTPLATRRKPGFFHEGRLFIGGDTGEISATGFPCRMTRSTSPFSTRLSNSDAFLRKSVKAIVVMATFLYTIMYTVCTERQWQHRGRKQARIHSVMSHGPHRGGCVPSPSHEGMASARLRDVPSGLSFMGHGARPQIRSSVSMPSRRRPCWRVRAVRSHRRTRLSRSPSGALRKGTFW